MKKQIFELTPREIVKELDQYIIGQAEAKRAVAIALRNRWRRRHVEDDIREEILPNNILMIGSTGVGKTEIARRLARLSGAPFVKVEASKYTEVGYVGRDVEGMVRDLAETAVSKVRNEHSERVEAEAEIIVEEKILDLLLPPPTKRKKKTEESASLSNLISSAIDIAGLDGSHIEEVEVDAEAEDITGSQESDDLYEKQAERYARSREKFRKKLRFGKLDNSEVEISLQDRGGSGMMQVFGPMGMEEMGVNLQEMLGSIVPTKKKKKKVSVGEAREILMGEEVENLLDMDAVIIEAMHRTEEMGIIFIDEVDKIVGGEESNHGPDVSREGVQRDILPIIEGTRVSTKYGPIRSDHILFIAAGAFHVSRPQDMIPELQGRFPIRVELDNLGKKEFVKILTEPKNSLTKQYTALFGTEKVELTFEKPAIQMIATMAVELNETAENIGARRLHTVMTILLEDELFKVPSKSIKKIVVTKAQVKKKLEELREDEDLSRYIL